jgi:predicted transglutaminase-like cysteine proteinase
MLTLWLGLITLIIGLLLTGSVKLKEQQEKKYKAIPLNQFGSGSIHEFSRYLEGESSARVTSIEDICRWLQACEYVRDPYLFQQNDFWQHPMEFEQHRRGDCEDHALWAWRKLIELGLEADFVVGHTRTERHAWVTFKHQGQEYLLETTLKYDKMVYLLETTQQNYRPDIGVDRYLRTYQYCDQTVFSYLLAQVKAWATGAMK